MITREIFDNVGQRGYFYDWSTRQVFYRQLVKLLEESCEAFLSVPRWPPQFNHLRELVLCVRSEARRIFDDRSYFTDTEMPPDSKTIDELSDVQVVVATASISGGLGVGYDTDVDILSLAREKSSADIERGVRNG